MVRRAVSACMEDHVRGDAKFLGGTDASDRTAGHGGVGLPLLQYSRVQSETTGWSSPEGGSADRVARRFQRRLRRAPRRIRGRQRMQFRHPSEHEHAAMRSRIKITNIEALCACYFSNRF